MRRCEELIRVPNTGEVVGTSIREWFQNRDNIALIKALKQHGLNFGAADRSETRRRCATRQFMGDHWNTERAARSF